METNILFTHKDLIEKSKAGERSAQFQLYELYVDAMYNVCMRLVGSKEDAEDLVQDMYIKLDRLNIELYNIKYGDDVNKYYFYTVLRNMAFTFIKKRKDNIDINDLEISNEDIDEGKECFSNLIDLVSNEVETWSYYDRTLFEVYMYSGLSFRDMAYGSNKEAKLISNTKSLGVQSVVDGNGISVSSMFNTIKKCKAKLKEKFGEDFEDYFNNDYDKI